MRLRRRRRNYYNYSPYSRRRRLNWKKVLIVVIAVLLLIALLIGINYKRIQLITKGYSFNQQNIILDLSKEDIDIILEQEKLENISEWASLSKEVDLYNEYEQYHSIYNRETTKDTVNNVNSLFLNYENEINDLGYGDNKIWQVLKYADSADVQYLLENMIRYDDICGYMSVPGFDTHSISEYRKVYNEVNDYKYAVMITEYPAIISSNFTNEDYTISNPDEITNLVKRGFNLPSGYEPSDLVVSNVKCAGNEQLYVREEAANALERMFADASKEGFDLILNSAYRSYSEQKEIYDHYFEIYDEVTAAGLVAKPGSSEHQTGLGVDLTCQTVQNLKDKGVAAFFGDSEDGKWAAANAHKYGFILRYPTSSNHITGISNEPWHFRYVGEKAATIIYENNWTLEEYCLYLGVLPELK